MAKDYCIYEHINKSNGKKYIGLTKQNPPEKRWGKNGSGYSKNKHFARAINKYSWDGFEHDILFESLTEKQAVKKEKQLIKKHKSNNPKYGYNNSKGGEV